jgi:hypothetical protein
MEMPIEDGMNQDVMELVRQERAPDFLSQAQQEYPYLKNKEIDILYNPKPQEQRYLEFYPPDEPGAPDMPRPKELPMGRVGMEVFRSDVRPIDILGDYVSHYGVQSDPELQKYYGQFGESTDPEMMQRRYQFHKEQFGETRPYDVWYKQTGLPELFRGYTFNQFGENAAQLYSPQQLMILDRVKQYLGIK